MSRQVSVLLTGLFVIASARAEAAYNATVKGTVATVQQMGTALPQYSAETFVFQLGSGTPSVCLYGGYFIISPNSVPDAQTRKNFVALVLEAKATGGTIEVACDNTGGFCDQGFPAVYFIALL